MDVNNLTEDQKKIASEFVSFLLDPTENNLIIQGGAGTGKSYLLRYLVQDGLANYEQTCKVLNLELQFKNFAVTATTNKAVGALQEQQMPFNPVTTVSFLGLHLEYNARTHRQELTSSTPFSAIDNTIIFVDECSMVNSDLFDWIQKKCVNCKIIYIGDKYQLPPVKEKISPIYNCGYREITLSEPVRNAGNRALVDLCEQLRKTCETGVWNDIHSVPGSIEVIKNSNEWQKIIDAEFLHSNTDKRILAYSNNLVTSYLEYLSELRNEDTYLVEGNWYVSNNYYKLNNFNKITLATDSLVHVLEISDNVPEAIYKYYNLDPTEPEQKEMLKKLKLESPVLNNIWASYVFTNPELHMKYMKDLRKYNPAKYYEVQTNTLDLRKSDVSTVHKAQGSTLNTVYIDLDDISKCTQKDVTAKLLYVAASRAKNKVVFYGELSRRYGVTVA